MWIDSGRSHVKGFSLLFFLWLIAIHWLTYETSFCKFCLLYMSIKIVLLSCCFHIVFFLVVFLADLLWKIWEVINVYILTVSCLALSTYLWRCSITCFQVSQVWNNTDNSASCSSCFNNFYGIVYGFWKDWLLFKRTRPIAMYAWE